MNPEQTTPSETARRLVADFVSSTCREAREGHGRFSLSAEAVEQLYTELTGLVDRPRAAELIDRSLRYIAFFLADCGMHDEAMKAAAGIHDYRARLMESAGRGSRAWATRFTGLSISVTWDPIRVVAYSAIAYLAFVASLLLMSNITCALTGEAAILMSSAGSEEADLTPEAYHHFYFAAVTLTTLGYGDVRPNLRHWWGVFPAALAALGSLAGYGILAAIVAVIMNRSGIHPYARIGEWMAQFEREVIGGPIPLFTWPDEERDDASA